MGDEKTMTRVIRSRKPWDEKTMTRVIRSRKPWDEKTMTKRKETKRKIIIYKTHITKYRAIRAPLKARGELRCSGRVGSSCSTCSTCRVTLVTNHMIRHEWRKNRIVIATNRTYLHSFDDTEQMFRVHTKYIMRKCITALNRIILRTLKWDGISSI
jgi:hypothetical protein